MQMFPSIGVQIITVYGNINELCLLEKIYISLYVKFLLQPAVTSSLINMSPRKQSSNNQNCRKKTRKLWY